MSTFASLGMFLSRNIVDAMCEHFCGERPSGKAFATISWR
mgnify:CR=1 FL=1